MTRPLFLALSLSTALLGCAPAQPLPTPTATTPAPLSPAAQQTEAATARLEASEGGRIVLRAINAVGGLQRWYDTPTSGYTWEYASPGSDTRFKTRMVVDNGTRQAYHDILEIGSFEEARPASGQFAWDGEEAWIHPAETEGIRPRFWATTGYYFSSIPFVLADPGLHYRALPQAELDGVSYDMVEVGYEENIGDASDTYTLYVDPQTDRLRAIRYNVTYGGRPGDRETLFFYEDYETVDGLTVPTRFEGYWWDDGARGEFKNAGWVTDISFQRPFDPARLVMPEGGRIDPLPAG